MKDIKDTFIEKLHECNQHRHRLLVAKKNLQTIVPLDVEKYSNLSDENISFIDQMIFRFSKLQDSMGEKIFPAILLLNGEDIKSKTFIDRLNRLEELNLLNKEEWMQLRKDRNEIAHEYSFNQDEVVDSINMVYELVSKIIIIYDKLYSYSIKKFDLGIQK